MGFKVDSSFLKFVSMGALGTQTIIRDLQNKGFRPIELERFCATNKIWMTKVKRLRLPDLLCVRTGLRIEARAKSKLAIRMSDAPNNPDRAWDAGLRDQDVIALTRVDGELGSFYQSSRVEYFDVLSMRTTEGLSRLGPPKSASEGAERDRTWPATIPSRPGSVIEIENNRMKVQFHGDDQPDRKQTYNISGKNPYLEVGENFEALDTILAGAPDRNPALSANEFAPYDASADLLSDDPISRYCAIKAARFKNQLSVNDKDLLLQIMQGDPDGRVSLEAAATLFSFGDEMGAQKLRDMAFSGDDQQLQMESLFILGEINTPSASEILTEVANTKTFANEEVRQAAVWGLGQTGNQAFDALIEFIDDEDSDVALHALAGLSHDARPETIDAIIQRLSSPKSRTAAAATEAFSRIDPEVGLARLLNVFDDQNAWHLIALSKVPMSLTKQFLDQNPWVHERLKPLLLSNSDENWLHHDDAREFLSGLGLQKL